MTITIDSVLVESLEKLEAGMKPNDGIRKLLIDKARKELIKYDLINRNFEDEYRMTFFEFRDSDLMKKPSEDIENDYFDWEMTVTILDDMRKEIEKLEI